MWNIKAYSEPRQSSTLELFSKLAIGFHLLTIFPRKPISDVWLNSEYISEINQTFINKNWLYTEAATGGIL